ncbi:class I SAM-dependent methyltransferase [Roseibium sp.]|uniref:class I SAM-dependent methyltransferase n=1 Tax=Roseibium sp. TaxID=1936156 RepID=UPI003BAEBE0E
MTKATHFAAEWLRNPKRVGAIAPSGADLARAITNGLSHDSGPVVELGPGTGSFTDRILACGVPACRLAAVEAGAGFADLLAKRHPEIALAHGDAARVRTLVPFTSGSVETVICGLPLLSMPLAQVFRIMHGSFNLLGEGGEFRLFTYGPKCPLPFRIKQRLGLRSDRQSFVPLNMPPATVYTLRRKGPP